MKRIILKCIVCMSLFGAAIGINASADSNIVVTLNGETLTFDVVPQMIDNRTMVPMRKIFEELGADVTWQPDTQTITAKKEDTVIVMKIDSKTISVDGKDIELDVAPQLIENRTLVPVRAVAEGLSAEVTWEQETQTVKIIKHETETKPTKVARYPKDGEMYGYGNDGIAELQYNARYMFEQSQLPKIVFQYEKETIDYIKTSNITKMKENILGIWEIAASNVIYSDAELSGNAPDINDTDAFWKFIDEKRPIYGLDDSHIVDVSMEKIDDNTSAIIVEMTDTGWTSISKYVAIAYNEKVGLKCFTLERSLDWTGTGDIPYLLCHVENGSRGSYFIIENDKQAFINGIKYVMNQSVSENKETK